ncbi:ArsA family ATPase [Longibacter sp.]|uniref:ArsA family ATPase n=1 Tax=Longibacter sp. TaxID=2045415 RepID=UPI003EBA48D1
MSVELPVLSEPPRLLWVVGKGGVGKTTVASALALTLGSRHRTHLLSTDPAHSIGDVLTPASPIRLSVEEINAAERTDSFRAAHGDVIASIIERGTFFVEDEVSRLLESSFPGMDVVMAFLRLTDYLPGGGDTSADTVIIDTAPTGHLMRLLDTPGRFRSWLDVLDQMLAKHRYMRSVFGGGGRDEMDTFLDDMYDRTDRFESAVCDESLSRAVVVMRAEPVVRRETQRLCSHLADRDVSLAMLVVNEVAGDVMPNLAPGVPCIAVPRRSELRSTDPATRRRALDSFWNAARPCAEVSDETEPEGVERSRPIQVERPVALPSSRIIMVAGKGGVGKTTLAAATALEAARRGASVLLASTDPAHSLSDIFESGADNGLDVGTGRVHVMEIDAEARFEALRDRYAAEVRHFFDEAGGKRVDLPYDRAVTEALMDLAPPGIDEVMGWLAIMEFVDDDAYHRCVIDTAPTGHFLQLLVMPQVFVEWIRVFFRILRAHQDILHLPDLTDRLVRVSKQTKAWTRRQNHAEIRYVGVATPEPVVQAETSRLVQQAAEAGAGMAFLAVNRVTPPDTRGPAEQDVLTSIDAMLTPDDSRARPLPPRVYRTSELHRVDRLKTLGQRLYADAS